VRAHGPLALWERVRAHGPLALWERVRVRALADSLYPFILSLRDLATFARNGRRDSITPCRFPA
jgi:hypothetical protein